MSQKPNTNINTKLKVDLKLYINPEKGRDFDLGSKLRVAIGNFDGTHLGHRYLIQKITSSSYSKSMVITFKSFNHSVFTLDQKIEALFNLGVDYVLVLPENIKEMRQEEFIEFLKYFNIDLITVGKNFRFGYQKEGSSKDLQKVASVFESSYILDGSSRIISSTRIRSLIRTRDIAGASDLLGYTPYIQGVVSSGVHRASALGFPTINITYPGTIYDQGVYLGRVQLYHSSYFKESLPDGITMNIGDRIHININEYIFYPYIWVKYKGSDLIQHIYNAVIHIGSRPTLRKINPDSYPIDSRVVEAHILSPDFKPLDIPQDSSDSYARFYILDSLAKEKLFSNEQELVYAINTYIKKAKSFFNIK